MIIYPIVDQIIRDIVRPAVGPPHAGFSFSPIYLFLAGEQGTWYDPSDLTTLFQDSAGTTPVTAHGQPVGLMLDKSRGLVLGSDVAVNGDFSSGSTGWATGEGWSIGGGQASKVSGVSSGLVSNIPVTTGKWYEISFDLVRTTGVIFPRLGFTNITGISASGSYTIKALADTAGFIEFRSDTGFAGTIDNISVRELPGHHASQPTAASRPLFQDVGGLRYLKFDGIDDWLSTASIDFTGTDKVSVFAGVRKLSDAAVGAPVELSANPNANPGAFRITTGNPANTYEFVSRGTIGPVGSATSAIYIPPISNVVTQISEIGSDTVIGRVNGTQAASSTVDQGTGTYGNYPLYIGRRAGTFLPFNGHLYGLIIRGALTDDPTTIKVEQLLAGKTGVQF